MSRQRLIIGISILAIGCCIVVRWVALAASSLSAAKNAPLVAYVVPRDLADSTVSLAQGMKFSYFGFDFEVPWNDLDEAKTRAQTPSGHPDHATLRFRSGLLLELSRFPVRNLPDAVSKEYGMSAAQINSLFGVGAATSDYVFHKGLYWFTPARMHYWAFSPSVHSSERLALMMKSLAPSRSAEGGIFNLQNQYCRGFQLGDPAIRKSSVRLELFFEDGGVEIIIGQSGYNKPAEINQGEVNRIVQSLHESVTPTTL